MPELPQSIGAAGARMPSRPVPRITSAAPSRAIVRAERGDRLRRAAVVGAVAEPEHADRRRRQQREQERAVADRLVAGDRDRAGRAGAWRARRRASWRTFWRAAAAGAADGVATRRRRAIDGALRRSPRARSRDDRAAPRCPCDRRAARRRRLGAGRAPTQRSRLVGASTASAPRSAPTPARFGRASAAPRSSPGIGGVGVDDQREIVGDVGPHRELRRRRRRARSAARARSARRTAAAR